MAWCIERGLDGVVTDDVPRFLRMCVESEDDRKRYRRPVRLVLGFLYFEFWIWVFGAVYWWRYGSSVWDGKGVDKRK